MSRRTTRSNRLLGNVSKAFRATRVRYEQTNSPSSSCFAFLSANSATEERCAPSYGLLEHELLAKLNVSPSHLFYKDDTSFLRISGAITDIVEARNRKHSIARRIRVTSECCSPNTVEATKRHCLSRNVCRLGLLGILRLMCRIRPFQIW